MTSAEWSAPADPDRPAPAAAPAPARDADPAGPASHEPSPRQDEPAPAVAELAELDSLDERPLAEHADVFGRVHAQLQAALAEVDGS